MAKPSGKRGSWFAIWNKESFPCVHKHWTEGIWPHHNDPHVSDDPKWAPFIEAIERGGKVILTEDALNPGGTEPFQRKGYIALYSVENVEVRGNELHFDFTERLESFT